MLIECPECRNSVSDQAATCPHCGVAIAGRVVKKPVQAGKPFRQWKTAFGLLFLVGILWPLFRAPDVPREPGAILMIGGFVGWLVCWWQLRFYTDGK
jgi:hypothetical protein